MTNGIAERTASRDGRKTSAERRTKDPLDPKVTQKERSLINKNNVNSREDRDTVNETRSSSSTPGILTNGAQRGAIPGHGQSTHGADSYDGTNYVVGSGNMFRHTVDDRPNSVDGGQRSVNGSDVESCDSHGTWKHADEEISIRQPRHTSVKDQCVQLHKERERLEQEIDRCRAQLDCLACESTDSCAERRMEFENVRPWKSSLGRSNYKDRNEQVSTQDHQYLSTNQMDDTDTGRRRKHDSQVKTYHPEFRKKQTFHAYSHHEGRISASKADEIDNSKVIKEIYDRRYDLPNTAREGKLKSVSMTRLTCGRASRRPEIRRTNQLQDCNTNDDNDENCDYEHVDDYRTPRRYKQQSRRYRHRRSSTSTSGDSASRTRSNHRKRNMRPDKFNGTSTSLETFLVQFTNCAHYCRWSEEDKLAYLRWSLNGTAAQLLCGTEDLTYEQLVEILKSRFGGQGMEERFQTELRCRRRKNGESLRELAQDIRRLMMLAYPGEKSNLSEHIARDFFLSAIDDSDLELKIREREPSTLDSAVKVAQRLEVFKSAVVQSSNARQRLSRQVTETSGNVPRDNLEDRVAEIERNLQTTQLSDISARHNQPSSEPRKNKQKYKQRVCATSVDNDTEWKEQLLKKLNDLETAQRVSEAQTKKISAENDALQKEVGCLRHLQQVRAVPSSNESQVPRHENDVTSAREARQCYNCGEFGHFHRRCPHPRRPREGDRASLQVNGTCENTDTLRKFQDTYLRATVGNRLCSCLLDTGSDVCIIPVSFVNLSQIEDTSRTLKAANGTPISTLGEVTLPMQIGSFHTTVTGLVSDHVAEVMLGIDWMVANGVVWSFRQSMVWIGPHSFNLLSRSDNRNWCRRVVLQENVTVPPRSEIHLPTKVVFRKLPASTDHEYWGTEPNVVNSGIYVSRTLLPCNKWSDVPVRVMNASNQPAILKSETVIAQLQPLEVINEDKDSTELKTTLKDQISVTMNGVENQGVPELIEKLMQKVDGSLPESASLALLDILKDYADVFSQSEYDLGRTEIISHHIDTGDARPVRQPLRRYPPAHLEAISTHVDNMLSQEIIEPTSSPWASNIVLVRKKDGSLRCCIDYRQLNSVTRKDAYPLPRIDSCLDAMSSAKWFSTFDLRSSYHQVSVEPNDRDKTAFICPRGMYRFKTMPFGLCNAGATFQRLMDVVMSGLHLEVCLVYLDDIILFSSSVDEHLERMVRVLNRLRTSGLKLKPEKCCLFQKSVSFLGHVVSENGIATDPAKTQAVADWPTPTTLKEVRSFLGLASYYRRFVKDFAQIATPLNALTRKGQTFTWTVDAQKSFDTLKIKLTSSPILAMPTDSCDFILDTDACDRSLGAVLSQVQNGVERVIAYASRSLDRREMNYCITRKELLAVVFSVKYFRQYLLGRHFEIRTDHAPLTWLRRTPDPVGQQARWLEILEEYDFRIEHRPGAKHGNADALSRRPCTVRNCVCRYTREVDPETDESVTYTVATIVSAGPADRPRPSIDVSSIQNLESPSALTIQDVSANQMDSDMNETSVSSEHNKDNSANPQAISLWSLTELCAAQEADSDISVIVDLLGQFTEKPPWEKVALKSSNVKTLWNMWPRLQLRGGVLHRRFEDANGLTVKWQVVLPSSLREEFLVAVHGGMTGGHLARRRTAAGIQSRAYWPTWSTDLDLFLRRCTPCARYHRGNAPRHAKLHPPLVGEPWERVSIDITGPHPRSLRSNRYILTLVDHFSKWGEAIPLSNHTAPVVARALMIHVFCRFGAPRQLLSDRGSEFESELFQRLMEWMGIDKLRTTVFKPSTNGTVERFHRTLNSMLGKVISESQRDWDEHLPLVLAAYRATVHSSTGFSPNRLFLSREVRMPIDLVMGIFPEAQMNSQNTADYVTKLQNQAAVSFEVARRHLGAAAERRKATYDIRAKGTSFSVGEWVWYWYPRRFQSKSLKWQKSYVGPYLVVRIIEPVNCVLQKSPKAKPFVVHFDKLKKCFEQNHQSWLQTEPATEGTCSDIQVSTEHGASTLRRDKTIGRRRSRWSYPDDLSETHMHTSHSRRSCRLPSHLSNFVVDF